MSTVAEVADRTFREHLYPLDDQPVLLTFDSDVTRDATVWPFTDDMLSPEEQDLLAPGVLVEADDGELALVTDVDLDAGELTVQRGWWGTDKAKHTSGTSITVSPLFSKRAVRDAVKDEVVALYPSLHATATVKLATDYGAIEVPAEVETVASNMLLVKSGTSHWWARFTFLANYPASSTGKAIFMDQPADGYTAYLTYEGSFCRPEYDSDELSDFGVEAAWERILAAGAAAKAVAPRDTDQLSAEYLTEQLEREALPNDAARAVWRSLMQQRSIYLDEARRAQRVKRPPSVVHRPVGAH